MKKRLLLALLLFVAVITLPAQQRKVTLWFKALNAYEQPCSFTKVMVTNVTRNWSDTLIYPDTVLVLSGTGVGELMATDCHLGKAYPNPFNDETWVPLELAEAGEVLLKVLRVDGTEISSYATCLEAGTHRVAVRVANPGLVLLVATTPQGRSVARLVSKGGDVNTIGVEPVSQEVSRGGDPIVDRGLAPGAFEPGDLFRYQAIHEEDGSMMYSQVQEWRQYHDDTIPLYFADLYPVFVLPTVFTGEVSNVTERTAVCSGIMTDNGGSIDVGHGFCWSTTSNPTINNHRIIIGVNVGNYQTTITNLVPGMTYYVRAFAQNDVGVAYGEVKSFTTLPCSESHESVNLGLPSGTLWATCNIGANAPEGYGNYYAWGEITPKSTYNWSNYNLKHDPNVLAPDDDAASVSWGSDWRMPTQAEWEELQQHTTRTWITVNGVNGCRFTGTNGNSIFIPAAGYYNNNSNYVGEFSYCWTNMIDDEDPTKALYSSFSTSIYLRTISRCVGLSVRPVRTVATPPPAEMPVVLTVDVSYASSTSAYCIGHVVLDGGASVEARGVCWSSSNQTPTLNDSHTSDGTGTGVFISELTRLTYNNTYYVRAYATNSVGTSYGQTLTYSTGSLPSFDLPTVITTSVTNIGQNSATCGGYVTDDGNATVTARGVCWSSINEEPTLSDSHSDDGMGPGLFTSSIAGLTPNTTYYVRAYATNFVGTAYGGTWTFKTQSDVVVLIPEVFTNSITNISQNSATCGGNVTDDGGAPVVERGICWGTSFNPSLSDSQHQSSGSGLGSFTVNITGLTPYTRYYVRAYAKNSKGTAYGVSESFTTLPVVPTGAINGMFTINQGDEKVFFSKGNLQYIGNAGSPYWKFADNQWTYFGNNGQGGTSQSANRDLFGWGTSGYNHGATCYQPWSTSVSNVDYYAYGSYYYNLYDQSGKADWGYNPISNGGNTTDQWRTLTTEEWAYVLNTRYTPSGIRFAKAKVSNVTGVILLPDDWSSSYYSLNNTNVATASYDSNIILESQWTTLEQHGAVFLPASGHREGTTLYNQVYDGYYWSSSHGNGNKACYMFFTLDYLHPQYETEDRSNGFSVRLVCPVGQ